MCPVPSLPFFNIPSTYISSPILNGDVLNPLVGVTKVHITDVPTVDSIVSIVNPFVLNTDLTTIPLSGSPLGSSKIFTFDMAPANSASKNPVSSFSPVILSTITKLGEMK